MKRLRTSSPYYYYYQGLWENYGVEVGESSKKSRMSAKTRSKQAQRENVRPYCLICDTMAKAMMGCVEQQKGEEEEKREVVEEDVVVEIVGEVEEEKREVVEKKVVENGEIEEEIKGDEGGKQVVVIDNGVEVDGFGDGENNAGGEGGGGGNGDGGVEEKNMDLFSSDIFGECDLLSGWEEWNYGKEQKWDCCYPFYWETEDGAYNYWDVLGNEAAADDWVESLWQF